MEVRRACRGSIIRWCPAVFRPSGMAVRGPRRTLLGMTRGPLLLLGLYFFPPTTFTQSPIGLPRRSDANSSPRACEPLRGGCLAAGGELRRGAVAHCFPLPRRCPTKTSPQHTRLAGRGSCRGGSRGVTSYSGSGPHGAARNAGAGAAGANCRHLGYKNAGATRLVGVASGLAWWR